LQVFESTRWQTAMQRHGLQVQCGMPSSPGCRVRQDAGVAAQQFYNSSADALVGFTMTDVKAIEAAVKALPPKDLAEFRAWFAEFDLAAWDSQVDADARSGKLDHLLAEAEQDYSAGQSRDL
jgi:hypothetical protein